MNKLVETWIYAQSLDVDGVEYARASWAIDELFALAHDDPDKLLSIVIEILKADASRKTIGALGAGVLEDFLVHHGNEYIDRIVDISNSNEKFKSCLQFTFLDKNDVSVETYEKFFGLKGP